MLIAIFTVAAFLLILFFGLSQLGANLNFNNDQQLYRRYDKWRTHAASYSLADLRGAKAWEEVRRMEDELKRRGYDMDKLGREAIDAKFEERPMDFSGCRVGGHHIPPSTWLPPNG